MQTFIFNPGKLVGENIILEGSEAHHIIRVLRLQKGELVRLIDGNGLAYICEISNAAPSSVICRIIKPLKNSGEASVKVNLAAGLSTGSKFDTIVEKGTEIGVTRFMPVLTQKGRVRIKDKESQTRKMRRWQRVAEAAAKQSGRSVVPVVDKPADFVDLLSSVSPERSFLFHPDSRQINLDEILKSFSTPEITLIVGPESGFTPEEIELAESRNIQCCGLGDRILRSETAAIVIPALIIYSLETVKA